MWNVPVEETAKEKGQAVPAKTTSKIKVYARFRQTEPVKDQSRTHGPFFLFFLLFFFYVLLRGASRYR
jgi:hypothetical protein